MQDQEPGEPLQRAASGKRHKYTPLSIVAGPLGLPFGLTFGKALGEAMEWGKFATVAAECAIAAVIALVLAVAINFFLGKEVEVTEENLHDDAR